MSAANEPTFVGIPEKVSVCHGDTDGDGDVDSTDFQVLATNFGKITAAAVDAAFAG